MVKVRNETSRSVSQSCPPSVADLRGKSTKKCLMSAVFPDELGMHASENGVLVRASVLRALFHVLSPVLQVMSVHPA